MPTVSANTITVTRQGIHISADGTFRVELLYTGSNGSQNIRMVTMPPDHSVLVDDFGGVVSSSPPASLVNNLTSLITNLDALIVTAAGGGKLNW